MGATSCASNATKAGGRSLKTIIVTGCAGLLGAHLTRHLVSTARPQYRVIGIDDLSGGYAEYIPTYRAKLFEFLPIDLSEQKSMDALNVIFNYEKPVACFHFAAYAAEGLSPFIRHFNYSNNVLASANVVNACINHDTKLIFTSSMAVYGHQPVPYTEDMTPCPVDPYGIAKYTVEMDIKVAGEQHGLRYNIVRPHNVVGIYQNIWDRYRNVVGIFIRRVLDGQPILIYGNGQQTRAFSDIEFYMKPFEKMITDHDGETYNIGADQSFTICQLAEVVHKVATRHGYHPTAKHVQARHEVEHAWCDHAKAKSELDFIDGTDLEATVDRMFKWAMTEPNRPQKTMPYEVEKGIYDYWK